VTPAVAFACVFWPGTRWQVGVRRLAMIGTGGMLSVIAVYGWAYSSLGIPPGGMIAKFLTLDGDAKVYGGLRISNVVNIPFGLLRNLFDGVPSSYAGFRSLAHDPHAAFWISVDLVSLVLICIWAVLVVTAIAPAVRRCEISSPLMWTGIVVSLLILA